MIIWGRLIGGLLGLMTAGPLGLFLGFLLGLMFDRSAGGVLRDNLSQPENMERTRQLFMELLFTALGDLAKADGRISEEEVQHTEKVIRDFNLNTQQREQAIAWFKEGAKPDNSYDYLLEQFAHVARRRADLRRVLLETLINLAMSDGELNQYEEQKLLHIAAKIGIPSFIFKQMLHVLKGQQQFRYNTDRSGGGGFHRASGSQLADAYQALGVSSDVSDKDLKKAYRKLMSENHPDKLIAKGVPESVLKMATEKSQAIQAAYELISKHRKKEVA